MKLDKIYTVYIEDGETRTEIIETTSKNYGEYKPD